MYLRRVRDTYAIFWPGAPLTRDLSIHLDSAESFALAVARSVSPSNFRCSLAKSSRHVFYHPQIIIC